MPATPDAAARAEAGYSSTPDRPILALCLISLSIAYAVWAMKEPVAAGRVVEGSTILALSGIALLLARGFYYSVGVGAALFALSLAATFNDAAVHLLPALPLAEAMGLNNFTVILGFLTAVLVYSRAIALRRFLGWAVVTHFLLLSVFQKDQLGQHFNPYEFQNPIQWLPTCIFSTLLLLQCVK